MSDVTTLGTSVVADRPVKVCSGIEDRPCGKEIPAVRTWCEDCSDERRKLKRRGYSSNAYQADPEPRKEKSRERYRQQQDRQECKVVIRMATWIKNGMDRERDLRFGLDRPLPPPLPKAYQRMRQPRRDRVFAQAQNLVIEEMHRANERLERWRENGRETARSFPYRAPRLKDILPEAKTTVVEPPRYTTTIHSARKTKRKRKAKRGRRRIPEAEKTARRMNLAASLFVRVKHEKMAPDEAWYALHPQSAASRENATRDTKRAIAWLLKERPLVWEDLFYLSGLYDFDEICRGIKEMLEATVRRKGKRTDLPNWYIRIRGLKLLMSCLGLATWRGFRSGPRAVGGEQQCEPIERNNAPAGDEDAAADVRRRLKAEAILFRHQFEGKPLADCWYDVSPHSEANRKTAKKEAEKLADWYQERYSSSLAQRIVANGLDEMKVLTTIKEIKEATRVFDSTLPDFPDWRTRDKGLDLQMVLLGFRPPSGGSAPRRSMGICSAMSMIYGRELVDPTLVDLESEEKAPPLSPEEARRSLAAGIYWRHFVEGKALTDTWVELHPEAKGTAASAAERELAWFQNAHPMDMATLMEVHGLGIDNLLVSLKELGEASKPLVTVLTRGRNDDGTWYKKITHILVEDWRAHDAALGKQMVLHGYGPGGWRRPAQSADCQEPDEPEEPPKTYEEAVARGKPYTFIKHPPEISHEEWQRQWDEYQAERERIIAKYGAFSEEYLTWLRNQNQRQR